MLYIGSHISASKGYEAMGRQALKLGANTFAFFTRNPRGGKAKDIDETDVAKFLAIADGHDFGKLVAHAPYTLNACAAKEDIRDFAKRTMKDDLLRMEYIPGNYYNFHPGSHVGQGSEEGIALTASLLNEVLSPDQATTVLLETMAGKGTEIGRNFEELRAILDQVRLDGKMGVCLDTCHVWDAGYDIVNDLDGVLDEFDRILGIDLLRAIHLNDSMMPFGSHKDRHAVTGSGEIGMDALLRVLDHPLLSGLPFYLETPLDDQGHKEEISRIREALAQKRNLSGGGKD